MIALHLHILCTTWTVNSSEGCALTSLDARARWAPARRGQGAITGFECYPLPVPYGRCMQRRGRHVSADDSGESEINGFTHEWLIGRAPGNNQEWVTEHRLQMKDRESSLRVYSLQKGEIEQLSQAVTTLTEQNQRLRAEGSENKFHLGKRPETPDEIEAEARFRELERRWEVELADRKHRADLAFEQSGLIRRAEGIRGWALVAVVFAIIASPWVAMVAGVAAKDFALYVTPVTGIAGAIIGYWFGQGQQNPLQPPTIADSPAMTPRSATHL